MARGATQSQSGVVDEDAGREGATEPPSGDPDGSACIKQASLPPLRWLLLPDADRFAHPAEAELARWLTFYGVRWAYEPTTFAVRWGSDGQPVELVTPDFYLPEHDLYLELTTMRQRLVTRKNRKFRKLRECYPNVRVRILYLRDFERLRDAFGPGSRTRRERPVHIGSTLFDARDLEARVAELASHLIQNWQRRPGGDRGLRPLLLGAGAGSARFLGSLRDNIRAQGWPVDHDWIELTAITDRPDQPRARVSRPPATGVAGRHVIVVQEVLSTGLSAAFLEGWLRRQGAGCVEICALLDREAARVLDVPVVCRGFTVPDVALAGYGLTRWRAYSDLPYIAEIETG